MKYHHQVLSVKTLDSQSKTQKHRKPKTNQKKNKKNEKFLKGRINIGTTYIIIYYWSLVLSQELVHTLSIAFHLQKITTINFSSSLCTINFSSSLSITIVY